MTSRVILALAVLGASALAFSQRPLLPPNYLLSSLPHLTLEVPIQGSLDMDDGQNFKDGSRVDLAVLRPTADAEVYLTLSSTDFDTFLAVFDGDGNLLDSNDDDYDGFNTDAGLRLWVTAGERYLIVVTGISAYDLGAYTLNASTPVSTTAERAEMAVPGTVYGTLDPMSAPRTLNEFGGPVAYYGFTLADSRLVDIRLSSDSFDAVLVLYDDQDRIVDMNDDGSYGSLDARITVALEPGTYLLAAGSYSMGEGGDFDLDVGLYVAVE